MLYFKHFRVIKKVTFENLKKLQEKIFLFSVPFKKRAFLLDFEANKRKLC